MTRTPTPMAIWESLKVESTGVSAATQDGDLGFFSFPFLLSSGILPFHPIKKKTGCVHIPSKGAVKIHLL